MQTGNTRCLRLGAMQKPARVSSRSVVALINQRREWTLPAVWNNRKSGRITGAGRIHGSRSVTALGTDLN